MDTKRTFTKAQLTDEYDLPRGPGKSYGGCTVISDEIVDNRRWSIDHNLVFRLDDMPEDLAWSVGYSVGATESQDERPWEYEKEITAHLVRRVEKVVQVWESVK